MFTCDCYPNHEICKNQSTCEFWITTSPELLQVTKQIEFDLNKLNDLKRRKDEYNQILFDIKQLKYCKTINIAGRLKRVPKLNARGEYILKPEDVQVGLNYNVINQEITDTKLIIRELRRKENNILKILKKRADKYD